MKAVQLTGPGKLSLTDIPAPAADGEHLLLKVDAVGICGTDVHYYKAGVGTGGVKNLILGHEFCGVVVDPGARKDLSPNDRIVVIPLNPCGKCSSCRRGLPNLCQNAFSGKVPGCTAPGAFAEMVAVRPDLVRKIPATMSDTEAAMIEPAAVALRSVIMAGVGAGSRVLIVGGGPIGMLCAKWARINGVRHLSLTEPNDYRREAARKTNLFDEVFDPREKGLAGKLADAAGYIDIVIESSGAEAGFNTGIKVLAPQGTLVLTGVATAPQKILSGLILLKELSIKATMVYTLEEFEETLFYIAEKRLVFDDLDLETIVLEEVPETFKTLTSADLRKLKYIVRPSGVGKK
jgi:2-desacetyl-2-hydroxyethyl bacteriochlorophyllide A dehydrogenase